MASQERLQYRPILKLVYELTAITIGTRQWLLTSYCGWAAVAVVMVEVPEVVDEAV